MIAKRKTQSSIINNHPELFSQAKTGYDIPITLWVLFADVLEQRGPCANHFQQSPAGGMVLAVALEMLGQLVNLLGQQGNLHLRRTGIALVHLEVMNDFSLF